MAFSIPATPPRSPEPPFLHVHDDAHPRAHGPEELGFLDASPTSESKSAKEAQPFFSLSASTTSSFNPVVGGSSTSTSNTPTRPTNPRVSYLRDESRDFASLPSTPLRSLDRFSTSTASTNGSFLASPPGLSVPAGRASWTWPPRSASARSAQQDLHNLEGGEAQHLQTTPTKRSREVSAPAMLGETQFSEPPSPPTELATRYVLVDGLEKGSTEEDLRNLLFSRCQGLGLRGCFTSLLHSHGVVVLVFYDVRHALAFVSFLSRADEHVNTFERTSSEALLDAKCIDRDTFEELHTSPGTRSLISRSEAVLVFTIRGPTSTPYFTPLPLLASFGDIRSLKVVEEHLQVVEYWDDRSAQTACEVLDGRERGGARFGCSFEPAVASILLESTGALPVHLSPVAPNSLISPPAPSRLAAPYTPLPVQVSSPSPGLSFSPPMSSPFMQYDISPMAVQPQPLASRNINLLYTQQTSLPAQQDDVGLGNWGTLPWSEEKSPPTSLNRFYASSNSALASSVPAAPNSTAFFASPSQDFTSSSPHTASPQSATFPPVQGSGARYKSKHRSKLSEGFGIVRDDKIPLGNVLNFERIEQGLDLRTTLMLKNIPNKLKDWEVMGFIDEVVGRSYDFFYLRCDYSNDCNVGYGFVNFTSTAPLLAFAKARLGTRWNMCGSDKLCIMSFANIQGKTSLINHFKNSSVLDQEENRRPKLFVTSGPNAGDPEPFPVCDDPIRKARSAANAQSIGLFPSHKPVFKVAQAFKGMHI
ncbi:hypothetical protein JCM11251_005745 [Rhodosporidiobolus azoricus]